MSEESTYYHTLLDDFLRNPRSDVLEKMVVNLEAHLRDRPPCPKCKATHIHKLGTNARKAERTQQFRCVSCNHVYSWRSILSNKTRENYSTCPQCQGKIRRAGHWTWEKKDGTVNQVQRYQCKNCMGYFRLEKKRGKNTTFKSSESTPRRASPSGGKDVK